MIKTSIKSYTVIAGIPIDDSIFDEEKSVYRLVDKEDMIDDLIQWISEIGFFNRERQNDKYLMKQDLKYLVNLEDEFVFSSIETNEYVAQSDNPDRFKEICMKILVLSGLTEEGAKDALSGECLD